MDLEWFWCGGGAASVLRDFGVEGWLCWLWLEFRGSCVGPAVVVEIEGIRERCPNSNRRRESWGLAARLVFGRLFI